jgi:hypothetical protein
MQNEEDEIFRDVFMGPQVKQGDLIRYFRLARNLTVDCLDHGYLLKYLIAKDHEKCNQTLRNLKTSSWL